MTKQITNARLIANYQVEAQVENFSYTMDYTEKNPENTSKGASPSDMMLVALSGCHLMTMISFLNLKKIPFTRLKCRIEGEYSYEREGWFLDAQVKLITDANLSPTNLDQAFEFIHRHCKISSILSKNNNIDLAFELL